MENKYNFKKLLCYNIVNNCKCVYKHKCMFAHTLEEQKKEPIRQYIYNMLYIWDDLSNININEDKNLLDELTILTKECKNCINKKRRNESSINSLVSLLYGNFQLQKSVINLHASHL